MEPAREIRNSAKNIALHLREVGSALTDVARNEVILFKNELQREREIFLRNAVFIGIAIGVACFSLLAFSSFCIIFLGEVFNHNYWFSSLLVCGVLLLASIILAIKGRDRFIRLRAQIDAPLTIKLFKQEVEIVDTHLRGFSKNWKRTIE